jgi:V-type H+-transporting ATPase subunit a
VDFTKTTLEQLRLVNVSGIIESRDLLKFSKMVFRATKGNSILYTFNIPNDTPLIGPRTAFIVILEAGSNVLTKVNRISDTFYAKKYTLPTNKDEIFNKIKEIEDTINDTKQLCTMTEKKLKEDLTHSISDSDFGYSKFEAYRILLERESLIFHTMNFLEERFNSLIAKVWITEEKRGLLFKLLPSVVTIREPETEEKPPTHFEMNSFTAPFQEIISTYGIPRYQ